MITRESTDDPTLRRVIASVEGLSESEILSMLSLALVVHALDHCMNDGTMGALLKDIVNRLEELSGGSAQLLFSMRRRIFIRLSYAERGTPALRKKLKEIKRKQQLGRCAIGQEDLPASGAELDRIDPVLGYTSENTQLVCHIHHREQQKKRGFA